MYSYFSTLLYNANNSSSVQQCYSNSDTLNDCNNGMCLYSWEDIQNPTGLYSCSHRQNRIEIRYFVVRTSPVIHITKDSNSIDFTCNLDKCNSLNNGVTIRKAIESDWGALI
ncbi:unnamed protein product [Adineta steineri]|uniref:Uncharacterized protein n=1 Tax=Adineta steineri TaxID=433720 RepID=A0A820AP02_9BILA|nr:unnamed protein product [Adineta steineri]